ncbi:MAG: redoxin domain-containing protein [Anaerolineales bacterium]|nr:redoxin domain-containing protein [Chloroflexota bacterium]MBL6981452.1 redoxin domain-containing protein [Anaerolineales bacterium]
MAQLRQDYEKFTELGAEIIAVGPENARTFSNYWNKNNLPFIGLPDPEHTVLKLYGQQIKLFKLGRMPAQVVIDKFGIARYVHYGQDMSDIPKNEEILALLEELSSPTNLAVAGNIDNYQGIYLDRKLKLEEL